MFQPGTQQKLISSRETDNGLYLDGGHLGEILLPKKFKPIGHKIGDEIEVFIHFDSEDRIVATTQVPFASLNDIAALAIKSATSFGFFLDWGLDKDLFLPFGKLKSKNVNVGDRVVVKIIADKISDRLLADNYVEKYLTPFEVTPKDATHSYALCYEISPLGYKMVVDGLYSGLLFKSSTFHTIHVGDSVLVTIKNIREDGKLDLSVTQDGYKNNIPLISKLILDKLMEANGRLDLSDNSPPDVIYKIFNCSKKNFKKALGSLYKERKILVEKDFIAINKEKT